MARGPRSHVDLKRMRYIVEAARAGSLTTAAETLAVTQPALTRSVAEVEEQLGTRLFHRLPRGIQLTEAGERFIIHARRILSEVDDLLADMRDGSDLLTGRVRLGVAPMGILDQITPALHRLATIQPQIKLEIVSGSIQTLCPQLLHGELNVVLGSSNYLSRWRDLEIRILRKHYFACMVRKEHPLAQLPNPKEVDVLSYPIIMPASIEAIYSDISQRYVQNGLPPMQPQYVTDNFNLTRTLVNATNAFHPLNWPSPTFEGLGDFLLLKDVVKIPKQDVSIAFSNLVPKTEAVQLFEKTLSEFWCG